MQKTCKHCHGGFEISSDDCALLEKLSPKIGEQTHAIPPPTLCPPCRQQRRMSFRNERHLYRRRCDVTGQDIISVFSPENPHKVCEKNHWYSDAFDPLAYGRAYDFSVPFFVQFRQLSLDIPLPSLRVERCENCEFNVDMSDSANCYLCSRTHLSQNCLYCYRGSRSNDCVDCTQVTDCSFLYECVECVKCQDSRYLYFSGECSSSAFLLDCRNCMDCFMCCNLRNKRYCFLNEQLTKEEFEAKLKEFDFGSRRIIALARGMYRDIRHSAIRRNLMIVNSENVSGDNILHSRNCFSCFGIQKCSDCRYVWDGKDHHDSMDEYSGGRGSELMYDTTSGSGSYDVQWCLRASNSQHIRYSFFTTASKNIFGCIGIRRGEYCILNRQYTKEEYEALVPKIIEHMRGTGEFGEFFPASCSPFAYNETAATEQFPLTKKEAEELGYRWLADEPKDPKQQFYEVPDTIASVGDTVTQETLCCETCHKNYKISLRELAFYRTRKIPLPALCPDCRYAERLGMKNPMKIRSATCARCTKDMLTSYPSDTDMQIYCEECYLKEVY